MNIRINKMIKEGNKIQRQFYKPAREITKLIIKKAPELANEADDVQKIIGISMGYGAAYKKTEYVVRGMIMGSIGTLIYLGSKEMEKKNKKND